MTNEDGRGETPTEFGMKVLTVETWREPDPIHESFTSLSDEESPSDVRAETVAEILSHKLEDQVPDEVRRLYRVARGAMLYGYLYYPLYTLASEQLYRVMDAALGHKCRELEGPEGLDTFQRRMDWLISEGVLREEDERLWVSYRNLRNFGSHPEDQSLILPGQAVMTLKLTSRALNALFDHDIEVVEFPRPRRPGEPMPEFPDH